MTDTDASATPAADPSGGGKRRRGRPILGAVAGLFFGLFVAFDLLIFKVIQSDSILFVALPVVFLVVGIFLGVWAPLGRGSSPAAAPTPPPAAAPSA